jgi:DNA-binding transcriptional regulator YiaG
MMITRMTLEQAIAKGGYIDRAKFESFTDADVERMIDEDPDLAPRTETLPPYLQAREIHEKLGLTQGQFAEKLCVSAATIEEWERDETPADPVLQALLRILDRIPEPALRALEGAAP